VDMSDEEQRTTADTTSSNGARVVRVVASAVLAVAVIGFFTGIAPAPDAAFELRGSREVSSDLPRAPSHADLAAGFAAQAAESRQLAAFGAMAREGRRALTEEPPVATAEEISGALALRQQRRAYDGAPPRVPHPMTQTGSLDCVACHQDGFVLEGRVARMMSHETYASCSQCHVEDVHSMPSAERALVGGPPIDTQFVGLEAPTSGPRAWEGAPPVIPHATQMRERCDSCHGVLAEGLRTSHPWRQSCTQCHAPSAEYDLRPFAELGPIGAAP
ncbi:MAG: hypothetical protein R3B99_34850, partial [Polyangiales bacterium]